MARRSEVELCFDSMSDLITNLAGGLILVVMLLLAVTRESPRTVELDANAATGKAVVGEKSASELSQRLKVLEIETARVDADISEDVQLLKVLDKKAEELLKKVESGKKGATK